jgi:hypothetical protein
MSKEYTIYCDESETKGRKYSNFYGGVIVGSDDIDDVIAAIGAKKRALNLHGEVKWTKMSVNYTKKYIELVDFFFDLVRDGKVRVRIMFTQNARRARRLNREHHDNEFGILYYYFIRYAFGMIYAPIQQGGTKVRVYADRLPMSVPDARKFKDLVFRLAGRSEFRDRGIRIAQDDVVEVVSHDHDLLQCLDIVLGAMNFRLNKKHKDKPEGEAWRSAKTRAKEKVYKRINKRIQEIYPRLNIGETTGLKGDRANRWHHRYRHWKFQTSERWR